MDEEAVARLADRILVLLDTHGRMEFADLYSDLFVFDSAQGRDRLVVALAGLRSLRLVGCVITPEGTYVWRLPDLSQPDQVVRYLLDS